MVSLQLIESKPRQVPTEFRRQSPEAKCFPTNQEVLRLPGLRVAPTLQQNGRHIPEPPLPPRGNRHGAKVLALNHANTFRPVGISQRKRVLTLVWTKLTAQPLTSRCGNTLKRFARPHVEVRKKKNQIVFPPLRPARNRSRAATSSSAITPTPATRHTTAPSTPERHHRSITSEARSGELTGIRSSPGH